MLLYISQIGLDEWIFAFMIVISFLIAVFVIPSTIAIFKTGRKEYFNQLRLLIKINKSVNICYSVDSYKQFNYQLNGQSKIHGFNETNYYYPIFESDTKITMILKKKGPFNKISIVENTKSGLDDTPWSWSSKTHEIKISCGFCKILNNRLEKKMYKLSHNPICYEDINEFQDFVNSEISSIKRENVLKSLLNE